MDPQCIALCDAMNKHDGIETFESCCGHSVNRYLIFFTVKDVQNLAPILNVRAGLRKRWHLWNIIATGPPGCEKVYFCLEGPKGEKAYRDAYRMAKFLIKEN
jgi:hypothetical protein